MLGYTQNELLGQIGLEFMAEDYVQQTYKDREGLAADIHVDREYKIHHKDGSIVWTLCQATPLYDKKGQYQGNLAMHTDITARKANLFELKQVDFRYYHEFFKNKSKKELIERYAVTGGVPKYIEQFQNESDIYTAIRKNVLDKSSFLL